MTTTDDQLREEATRRIFQTLRERGDLAVVLGVVRDLHRITEGALRVRLSKKVIRKPEDLADFQAQQGKLAGYLDVLRTFESYAKPNSQRQPVRRPDPGEAPRDNGDA